MRQITADDVKIQHRTMPDGSVVRYCRIYLGRDYRGKPVRPQRSFPDAKTDEEAVAMALEWASSRESLLSALERYVDHRETNGSAANTVDKYRSFLQYVELAGMAGKPLVDVRAKDIDDMQDFMLTPKADGGLGLAGVTVLGFHWFLSGAFKWFVLREEIATNPVPDSTRPQMTEAQQMCFDEYDLDVLVAKLRAEIAVRETPSRATRVRLEAARAAAIALETGMRVGEVCALRRCDVSRDELAVTVSGTVVERRGGNVFRQGKTKGRRERKIAVTTETMSLILAGFDAHESAPYVRHGKMAPIIAYDRGWARPSDISKAFKTIVRDAGLDDRYKFHSLRHTHATMLLRAGEDIRTVSERLGHANAATTLKLYVHSLPARDRHAAERFGGSRAVYQHTKPEH